MSLNPENSEFAEKHATAAPDYKPEALEEHKLHGHANDDPEHVGEQKELALHQDLKGRHMQMIAMQVQQSTSSFVY